MITLEFTEKQILGLLPAQALVDYDRAKEVLEKVAKSQAEITKEETLKAMGEWIDRNILSTDNRVTKLWVLGDAMKALREGKFPK